MPQWPDWYVCVCEYVSTYVCVFVFVWRFSENISQNDESIPLFAMDCGTNQSVPPTNFSLVFENRIHPGHGHGAASAESANTNSASEEGLP